MIHNSIQCWTCQQHGHYAGDCPSGQQHGGTVPGTTLTQYAFVLAQAKISSEEHGIDPDWILLDSQSTISVFKNANKLTNIRRSKHVLRAFTNGGHQDSRMVGDFPNLGEVWYNRESIANILSLAEVRKVCRVTMDTLAEPALLVHRLDGTVMKFLEHPSGLYVYKGNDRTTNDNVTGYYTMVSTVAQQKKMFSRREVALADAARELYRKIGRPDEVEFQKILQQNLIRNCPVTPTDAKRALLIYGPDIAVLKGKTTRSAAAPRVPTFVSATIPAPILEHHRQVTLCADVFFVQGLPFFHTISRGIGFRTAHSIPDRSRPTFMKVLRKVIHMYETRGLEICDIHSDNELECVRASLLPIVLNTVPADSHVGEVERSIRTIKERIRSCAHGLPFKRLPRLMVTHMVADAVRCLNQFPWKNGISDTMSPAGIVTGIGLPDYHCMRIEFGSYAQVLEDNDPSNTLRSRSLGAMALTPTGNAQGDYYFLSLATGNRLSRHTWTALPMTETAIARVEALALHDGQPLLQNSGLVVEWRPNQPIDDSEYDHDYEPPNNVIPVDFADDDYVPVDHNEIADLLADQEADMNINDPNEDDNNSYEGDDPAPDDDSDDDYDNLQTAPGAPFEGTSATDSDDADERVDSGADQGAPINQAADQGAPTENEEMTADQGAPTNQAADQGAPIENEETTAPINQAAERPYNLRQRNVAAETFKHAMDSPHNEKSYFPPMQLLQRGHSHMTHADDFNKYIFRYIMNQMSAKVALRKHGKDAEAALMKEFAQLEDLDVYEAIHAHSLTKEQRQAAMRAMTLVKEKRDGSLKGRTVADGRSQRGLYDKSQTASPTVSTDALILSIMIDAYEQRDVGTADVAGAYLKAYMDDFVVMKFTGKTVDILCAMNPCHEKFVIFEKGTKVLYVRLIKGTVLMR